MKSHLPTVSAPTHIQIGRFKRSKSDPLATITDLIDLKYRDCTELNVKAMKESLLDMKKRRKNLQYRYDKYLRVHIVHPFDDVTYWCFYWRLNQVRFGMIDTVQPIHFGKDRDDSGQTEVNFWWDLKNGVMWTSHYDCSMRTIPALINTFENIDLFNVR